MTNYEIADAFTLLAKLMDIHGENSFKSKSYASAAFAIEKLQTPLAGLDEAVIAGIKGIGASSAKKIIELLQTGQLSQLTALIAQTPEGIIEMMQIKGIGPKKIHSIWKEMEIETIGELLYACKENRLKLYKGFGEKTQQNVLETITYYLNNKGSFLYSQTKQAVHEVTQYLNQRFNGIQVTITGDVARQMEIITALEFVIESTIDVINERITVDPKFSLVETTEHYSLWNTQAGIQLKFYAAANNFTETCIKTSSSTHFYEALQHIHSNDQLVTNEATYFENKGLPFIPSFAREDARILTNKSLEFQNIVTTKNIKGLIHCHSNWSDGNNTIEEMALAALQKNMEYMVITDHSKSAFYAQGLQEDRIKAQHQQIDELNKKLHPFKIYKSIESDILNDGSLDYSDAILSTFDVVIASVHSNLKMQQEKAMERLLKAIENPYTTILGHMTGRLLLSRPGYPLDFKKIIDACAANNVVIELNANPNRLDIDWREIPYALEKNVLISINPDAHSTDGIDDVEYGVYVAQKALVNNSQNLSSYNAAAFDAFVNNRKSLKNI
ncbi:helix-hairpin-helix domain-containing protein [Ferruginibacter yonginensis]|uniref:Helix-hairpin-helix domain-containing protein n=1 Tax=Ferruginibacter yonginensis TaxID=1310416 RepID=A0ABV8QVF0_9BACT